VSRIERTRLVDDDGLAGLRAPRRDLVREDALGDDTFALVDGPFRSYHRTLEVHPDTAGRHRVTERTEFSLAVPLWGPVVRPLMARALADTNRRPRNRWWWPAEVVGRRTSELIGALCVISVMAGYLGVVIGQTITFAAADFGRTDAAQANTLAATRVGVLVSVVLIHRADRIGRRPLILWFTTGAILFTVAGAAAPNLAVLGATQTIGRGLTTGLITLIMLAATEEAPAGSRALAISLATVAAALGAGMVLWVLPVAGVAEGGWRVVYLVPLVFLPLLWWVARHLPETRRFDAAAEVGAPASVDWWRFALIGGTAFLSAIYLSPASQLRNEFLRDDRGFSAAGISLFQLLVSTPAGVSILIAGRAADKIGRRRVGAVGVAAGAALSAVSYQVGGVAMWLTASAGVILAGAAFPATRGYSTELFPTRARARVGGLLDAVTVAGSAVGLVVAGYLAQRWGDLGDAITVLAVFPVLVAAAILLLFPETAAVELEAFNPDDPALDDPATTAKTATTTTTTNDANCGAAGGDLRAEATDSPGDGQSSPASQESTAPTISGS